jgi:hypothetical protein
MKATMNCFLMIEVGIGMGTGIRPIFFHSVAIIYHLKHIVLFEPIAAVFLLCNAAPVEVISVAYCTTFAPLTTGEQPGEPRRT